MRSIVGKFLTYALLLSALPVVAQSRPRPSPSAEPRLEWLDLSGDWEIGIHALYYSPFACEFDYATSSATEGGPVATVRCQLDWGFRVYARTLVECNLASISYQWFGNKEKRRVEGLETVRNLFGIPAERAIATVRIEYQNADFRFGQFLHRTPRCDFYLFGNARWIDLLLSHNTRAITATPLGFSANEKARLEGGAIGMGGGAEFAIGCNFGLFGDLNLLGVIAKRSTWRVYGPNSAVTTVNNDTEVRYDSEICMNPEVDAKIGINYTYDCDCISFVGELGYEIDYFWNPFAFPRGSIAGGTGNPDRFVNRFRTCEDAGFSGLFFGAHIFF